ncbi:MAG TPA: hypothetical protein VHR72_10330 [Gemmataceae bacterium]|jgi:hypothetical protein|nr:hypothetical protein [Gemmataceae bacterium]
MDFKEHFVREKAKALAQITLTRRADLIVDEGSEDADFDYLVHIRRNRGAGIRNFGVFLRASMAQVDPVQANEQLRPAMAEYENRGPYGLPVCVFYFTAKDDKGYFAWVSEPLIDRHGVAKLKSRDRASCRELTAAAFDEIVDSIDRWYDALLAALTA